MRRLAQARNPYSQSWLWIPGSRFARPGMTEVVMKLRIRISNSSGHSFAISPHVLREVLGFIPAPEKSEGAGNTGRAMRPQPRVQLKEAHERSHHGHTGITRHSPRNGFNGLYVLSPVTGLVCHRRRRNCFRQLDASVGASGPHAFAVRLSAVRYRRIRVHRIPPRVRDDREPPLCGTRRGNL
jgi:hypothetical protein